MTHDYRSDPRNDTVLIDINGELFPRNEAKISVFDSGFMLGDGVWEGLRLYGDKLAFLDQHLDRLYEGTKALDFVMVVDRASITERLYACLKANNMSGNGVHLRLMVTRGVKSTPYQDPRVTITPPTIVIIPEYKDPVENDLGISLFTGYRDYRFPPSR